MAEWMMVVVVASTIHMKTKSGTIEDGGVTMARTNHIEAKNGMVDEGGGGKHETQVKHFVSEKNKKTNCKHLVVTLVLLG